MARIVKDADERRDELLDVAMRLFLDNGYEHTSVEQITSTVGVAKGTFYHYFATKQDLLVQLVDCFADELFVETEAALDAADGSALDRLRALIVSSSRAKLVRKEETLTITRSLYAEENQFLLHRLTEGWIDRTRPLIRSIIDQGCAEGTFVVPDPAAMTEIWLSLWFDCGSRMSRLFFAVQEDAKLAEQLLARLTALQLAEERVLGVAEGSLDINLEGALREVLSKS